MKFTAPTGLLFAACAARFPRSGNARKAASSDAATNTAEEVQVVADRQFSVVVSRARGCDWQKVLLAGELRVLNPGIHRETGLTQGLGRLERCVADLEVGIGLA